MKLRAIFQWIGISFLGLLVVFAIAGPMFGHSVTEPSGPIFSPAGVGGHLLGTDDQGRDILARLAAGARVSLLVGLSVQIIALIVGVIVGVIGVFGPRWIAAPLLRFTDGMFAFPDILLGILLIGTFQAINKGGTSLLADALPVIVVLAVTAWPSFARLTVTTMQSLKDREFAVAAKASGASTTYLVTKHLLPQMVGLLLAVSMVELAGTILAESTLSFIGIGVQPPTPSWGSMVDMARRNMSSHPSLLIWPCLALSLTIFSLNFVGDGLRERFDPRSK
jgi:ABC-type dipeptide/oligopeptide/nickel transport system permease subunit